MFEQAFYDRIKREHKNFSAFVMLSMLFLTGISFSFVIPTLSGFNYILFCIVILFYIFIANIYVGLYEKAYWKTFIFSLLLSIVGMGWRLALEWGEATIAEHQTWLVIVLYPIINALIITTIAFIIIHNLRKQSRVGKIDVT